MRFLPMKYRSNSSKSFVSFTFYLIDRVFLTVVLIMSGFQIKFIYRMYMVYIWYSIEYFPSVVNILETYSSPK